MEVRLINHPPVISLSLPHASSQGERKNVRCYAVSQTRIHTKSDYPTSRIYTFARVQHSSSFIDLDVPHLILLNKPYGVLTQFTDREGRPTLARYVEVPEVRPAGRLDQDSEGLVVLTDMGWLQTRISHPRHKLAKTYWVQVEGIPSDTALKQLAQGVMLNDGVTQPARARRIEEPSIWPRTPPVRYRAAIPTAWIELIISEGRNRQVRRMTAAVGYPTLRLIRYAVGPWNLNGLSPGQSREVPEREWASLFPPPKHTQTKAQQHDFTHLETQRHRRRHHRT